MKNHILGTVSQSIKKFEVPNSFYDFATQMSYLDQQHTDKLISHFWHASTVETSTIENSDSDGFSMKPPQTIVTETIENSDTDEMKSKLGTMETRQIETSDSDGYYLGSSDTKATFTIETSDPDEFSSYSSSLC